MEIPHHIIVKVFFKTLIRCAALERFLNIKHRQLWLVSESSIYPLNSYNLEQIYDDQIHLIFRSLWSISWCLDGDCDPLFKESRPGCLVCTGARLRAFPPAQTNRTKSEEFIRTKAISSTKTIAKYVQPFFLWLRQDGTDVIKNCDFISMQYYWRQKTRLKCALKTKNFT